MQMHNFMSLQYIMSKWSDSDLDQDPNRPKCSVQNRTGPVASDISQDPQHCQKIEKQHKMTFQISLQW
jgi:hypothetical protein